MLLPTEEELLNEITRLEEEIKMNEINNEWNEAKKMEIFSPKSSPSVTKSKRGRPRKHLFPQAEEYLKACNSMQVEDIL